MVDKLSDIMRNYKFTVEIDGKQIGFMRVDGLSGLENQTVTLTRGRFRDLDRGYLIKWMKSRERRTVVITVDDCDQFTLVGARPVDHYFTGLDAGANSVWCEVVTLDFIRSELRTIEITTK